MEIVYHSCYIADYKMIIAKSDTFDNFYNIFSNHSTASVISFGNRLWSRRKSGHPL